MTLQELFDELLLSKTVTVEVNKQQAEILRVGLSKKWKRYRDLMDSCGFLEPELQGCGIRRAVADGAYTFSLAPPSRELTQYTIIGISTAGKESCDSTNVSG